MTDEKREQAIQAIADMMRDSGFNLEFKVKKKPAGVKVIIEVTQEQMDTMVDNMKQKKED
jgi:hypothetical protein